MSQQMMLNRIGNNILILDEYQDAVNAISLRLLTEEYSEGLIKARAYDGTNNQGKADILPYKVGNQKIIDLNSKLLNLDSIAISRGLTINDTLADLVDHDGLQYKTYAECIYDQIDSNDYIQLDQGKQAVIYQNGNINKLNGMPILKSDGVNTGYLSNFNPNVGGAKDIFFVGNNDNVQSILFGISSDAFDFCLVAESGSTSTFLFSNLTVNDLKLNGITKTFTNRNDVFVSTTNQFLLNINANFDFKQEQIAIGYNLNSPNYTMYNFQENIIFSNINNNAEKNTKIKNVYKI